MHLSCLSIFEKRFTDSEYTHCPYPLILTIVYLYNTIQALLFGEITEDFSNIVGNFLKHVLFIFIMYLNDLEADYVI